MTGLPMDKAITRMTITIRLEKPMAIRDLIDLANETVCDSIKEGYIGHHVTTTGGDDDAYWYWDVTWEPD